jgi:hypothetical protein
MRPPLSRGLRASRENDEDSQAFVYHRPVDDEPDLHPVPAQHYVCWIDGELGMCAWPERRRAEVEASTRHALEAAGHDVGPPWSPGVRRRFRVLSNN